jgi:hypothetical protein
LGLPWQASHHAGAAPSRTHRPPGRGATPGGVRGVPRYVPLHRHPGAADGPPDPVAVLARSLPVQALRALRAAQGLRQALRRSRWCPPTVRGERVPGQCAVQRTLWECSTDVPHGGCAVWAPPSWVRHMATFLRPDAPSGHQGLHALSVVRLAGGWKSGTISCPIIANWAIASSPAHKGRTTNFAAPASTYW